MWRLVWLLAGVTAIPPHQETARVARFVAHVCDWGALATISTQDPPMRGQPFANVFSISDGPVGKGSGVPYMYLTELEISVHDLKVSGGRQHRPGYVAFTGSARLVWGKVSAV